MFIRSASSLALAAALSGSLLFGQSQTIEYSYSGLPIAIAPDSANIASVVGVFIPQAFTIQSVRVTVDIDYPRPGDLNVFFYSANATRTKLLERNCGSTGNLRNITFDDFASLRYADACPTGTGSFRGNEPLANSQGQNSFGLWTLGVENNGSDSYLGRVIGFRISITGTPAVSGPVFSADSIVSASSLQRRDVAPGDMLDIFGVGLGPSPGQLAPAGNLPLSLGGTQVTIGGRPVALRFAGAAALQVQLPYDVPGGDHDLLVTYNGRTSAPVRLRVTFTNPGVFTVATNGTGAARAINQDGTENSSSRGAPRNSVVALYLTGLGTLNPNLSTGQAPPTSPLSVTTQVVTATVDGIAATVEFAGAAPGLPGTYQVNVKIPSGAGTGLRDVTVFGNGVASQGGVGIWVQ